MVVFIRWESDMTAKTEKCFACGRKLGRTPKLVTCADDQTVHVGVECYREITKGGADGYQPPRGGPRLYLIQFKPLRSAA
jgi:hypothetical protein